MVGSRSVAHYMMILILLLLSIGMWVGFYAALGVVLSISWSFLQRFLEAITR